MREEMAVAARLARKQLKTEQTKGIVTRKLGRFKFEEPNLELKLSGELPSSLRLLKVRFYVICCCCFILQICNVCHSLVGNP